jgi:NADPH:quinone reductase-like Zn-dependent oxidoreductase
VCPLSGERHLPVEPPPGGRDSAPLMNAWIINGTDGFHSLTRTTLPDPAPGPGEALVRVRAVSLNYRDYMNVTGIRGITGPVPRVPCSDGAGEVAAAGPGVTDWRPGDRVVIPFMPGWLDGPFTQQHAAGALGGAVDGVMREFIAVPASSLIRLPDAMSFETACTLPCAAVTAWDALFERGNLQPGQTVLVQGTGGVSSFAAQFASNHGARVLGITSSAEKEGILRGLGASAVLNYREHPEWADWALEQTGGAGVDAVVEIGGPATLNQSLKATRFGGHVALIGVLTGTAGDVQTVAILRKGIRLDGIYVGSRAMLERVVAHLSTRGMEPLIDRVFEFDAFHEALRRMEAGAHAGKIVVRV